MGVRSRLPRVMGVWHPRIVGAQPHPPPVQEDNPTCTRSAGEHYCSHWSVERTVGYTSGQQRKYCHIKQHRDPVPPDLRKGAPLVSRCEARMGTTETCDSFARGTATCTNQPVETMTCWSNLHQGCCPPRAEEGRSPHSRNHGRTVSWFP